MRGVQRPDPQGRTAPAAIHGTTWLNAGAVLALWTVASAAATVFKIVADGSRATLATLYGALRGILVSDRATALSFWAMDRRQICWAHLLRKFVAFCAARPTQILVSIRNRLSRGDREMSTRGPPWASASGWGRRQRP